MIEKSKELVDGAKARMASVTVPDAKTLVIQPWEKKMIPVMDAYMMRLQELRDVFSNSSHRSSFPARA